MSIWINIAKVSDFPPNTWQIVDTDKVSVLVFHLNSGSFYAIENTCTHDGGELSDGWLEGEEMVCPRHGARFCVRTGAVTAPPAYEDIQTFAVRIVDDLVQVNIL